MYSDDGGDIFLRHHYTIDTAKRIFYKAVYDYVHLEQVTFYYHNQKITKAIASDTPIASDTSTKAKPYKCEYYFDNDSVISIRQQGTPHFKKPWNKKTITAQAKEYLIDSSGILEMLDKRK